MRAARNDRLTGQLDEPVSFHSRLWEALPSANAWTRKPPLGVTQLASAVSSLMGTGSSLKERGRAPARFFWRSSAIVRLMSQEPVEDRSCSSTSVPSRRGGLGGERGHPRCAQSLDLGPVAAVKEVPGDRSLGNDGRDVSAFEKHVVHDGAFGPAGAGAAREIVCGLERVSTLVLRVRRVRGAPVKDVADRVDGEPASSNHHRNGRRMPEEESVEVIEETLAHHVDPAVVDLLRGRAVEPNRSGKRVRDHGLLDGDTAPRSAAPMRSMPAAVPRSVSPGKGIEKGDDSNDWLSASVAGDESRGEPRDAGFDCEARALELACEIGRRLNLVVSGLRSSKEVVRDTREMSLVLRKPVERGLAGRGGAEREAGRPTLQGRAS